MRTTLLLLLGAVLLAAPAVPAAAQSRPMPPRPRPVDRGPHSLWVLHVQLAAPQEMIGAGVHYVAREGWGGYGSLWLSTTNLAEDRWYYETLSTRQVEELGALRRGEESQWGGGRFGLTRRLGRQLYAYGGFGLMRGRHFIEYRFQPPLAAPDGTLWVDDSPRDSVKGVVEAGLVFYTEGGIAFSLGLGTHPAGVSFGMGFGTRL